MLQPKRTSLKMHKVVLVEQKNRYTLDHLGYKLFCRKVKASVIESMRRVVRKLKRQGQIWIRIFPDIVVSEKPAEVRMGKGKGSPSYWICRIQKGQVLFELDGVPKSLALQALKLALHKCPIPSHILSLH